MYFRFRVSTILVHMPYIVKHFEHFGELGSFVGKIAVYANASE